MFEEPAISPQDFAQRRHFLREQESIARKKASLGVLGALAQGRLPSAVVEARASADWGAVMISVAPVIGAIVIAYIIWGRSRK